MIEIFLGIFVVVPSVITSISKVLKNETDAPFLEVLYTEGVGNLALCVKAALHTGFRSYDAAVYVKKEYVEPAARYTTLHGYEVVVYVGKEYVEPAARYTRLRSYEVAVYTGKALGHGVAKCVVTAIALGIQSMGSGGGLPTDSRIADPQFMIASSSYVAPLIAATPAWPEVVVAAPHWNRSFPPLLAATPAWPEVVVAAPHWNRSFPPLIAATPAWPQKAIAANVTTANATVYAETAANVTVYAETTANVTTANATVYTEKAANVTAANATMYTEKAANVTTANATVYAEKAANVTAANATVYAEKAANVTAANATVYTEKAANVTTANATVYTENAANVTAANATVYPETAANVTEASEMPSEGAGGTIAGRVLGACGVVFFLYTMYMCARAVLYVGTAVRNLVCWIIDVCVWIVCLPWQRALRVWRAHREYVMITKWLCLTVAAEDAYFERMLCANAAFTPTMKRLKSTLDVLKKMPKGDTPEGRKVLFKKMRDEYQRKLAEASKGTFRHVRDKAAFDTKIAKMCAIVIRLVDGDRFNPPVGDAPKRHGTKKRADFLGSMKGVMSWMRMFNTYVCMRDNLSRFGPGTERIVKYATANVMHFQDDYDILTMDHYYIMMGLPDYFQVKYVHVAKNAELMGSFIAARAADTLFEWVMKLSVVDHEKQELTYINYRHWMIARAERYLKPRGGARR